MKHILLREVLYKDGFYSSNYNDQCVTYSKTAQNYAIVSIGASCSDAIVPVQGGTIRMTL